MKQYYSNSRLSTNKCNPNDEVTCYVTLADAEEFARKAYVAAKMSVYPPRPTLDAQIAEICRIEVEAARWVEENKEKA